MGLFCVTLAGRSPVFQNSYFEIQSKKPSDFNCSRRTVTCAAVKLEKILAAFAVVQQRRRPFSVFGQKRRLGFEAVVGVVVTTVFVGRVDQRL